MLLQRLRGGLPLSQTAMPLPIWGSNFTNQSLDLVKVIFFILELHPYDTIIDIYDIINRIIYPGFLMVMRFGWSTIHFMITVANTSLTVRRNDPIWIRKACPRIGIFICAKPEELIPSIYRILRFYRFRGISFIMIPLTPSFTWTSFT